MRRKQTEPLIEIAVEAKSRADDNKLGIALRKLAAEDPTFRVSTDDESGQTIIGGMTEKHLDTKINWLKLHHQVDANIGQPQVAYRETLGRRTEINYTHKKQTGGSGQFAEVTIVFEPVKAGTGYSFENKVVGGSVPRKFASGVKKGLLQAKEKGLLAGFPVIDFKATLIDGKYHDLDSSVLAFEIASRAAFRELREKAQPKLLEPIMKVEVTSPEAYTGDLIGDLKSRRGVIQSIDQRGNAQVIIAMAPLANMFGYVATLTSIASEKISFEMSFAFYRAVDNIDDGPNLFPPAAAMKA